MSGELTVTGPVRVMPAPPRVWWVEWATPDDGRRETRQVFRSDAVEDGGRYVTVLSEGMAPCHSRHRLTPCPCELQAGCWGVCEACGHRWRLSPLDGTVPAGRGAAPPVVLS